MGTFPQVDVHDQIRQRFLESRNAFVLKTKYTLASFRFLKSRGIPYKLTLAGA